MCNAPACISHSVTFKDTEISDLSMSGVYHTERVK